MRIRKTLGYLALLVFCLVTGPLALLAIDGLTGFNYGTNTLLASATDALSLVLAGATYWALLQRWGSLIAILGGLLVMTPLVLLAGVVGYHPAHSGFVADGVHDVAAVALGMVYYAAVLKFFREIRKVRQA